MDGMEEGAPATPVDEPDEHVSIPG